MLCAYLQRRWGQCQGLVVVVDGQVDEAHLVQGAAQVVQALLALAPQLHIAPQEGEALPTHTHAHARTCKDTHSYTHTQSRTHGRIRTNPQTHTRTLTHTGMREHSHTHTHKCTHAHTHSHARIHIQSHKHTVSHTHTEKQNN